MAVNVSKIPNNNKFDPVREAILDLQGQLDDTGGSIGNGTLTVSTSGTLTGSGTFTANQSDNTTITIGIDDSTYLTSADISDFITLTDLSVTTSATPSGGGALSYDDTTGVFTFTPADAGTGLTLQQVTANGNTTTYGISTGNISVQPSGTGNGVVAISANSVGDAALTLTPGSTAGNGVIRTTIERGISFKPFNTEKVFIASDGNMNVYEKLAVGKTTAASTYHLEVDGTALANNFITSMTASGTTYTGTVSQYYNALQIRTATGGTISIGGSGPMSVQNNVKIKNGDLEITRVISGNGISYPLTIQVDDTGNNVNQIIGDGVGLQFKLANNDTAGGSFLGGSIAAVRESATDSDSSTSLEFYTSNNDETLDKQLTINSSGTVTANAFVGDGSGLTNLPGGSADLQDVTDNGATTTRTIQVGGLKTDLIQSASQASESFIDLDDDLWFAGAVTNVLTLSSKSHMVFVNDTNSNGTTENFSFYTQGTTDANATKLFEIQQGGDVIAYGNIIAEDAEVHVGDVSGDSWTRIKHAQADGYGFDWTHDNATVIVNEQGTTNEALVLGDVNTASTDSGLFGISYSTDGGANWTKKLDLRGNGDLYVGSSGTTKVLTTDDEGSGNGLDADTIDGYHATSFFIDGDTVINMANNDGFVYDDTNNIMKVKYDGTEYDILTAANYTNFTDSKYLRSDADDTTTGYLRVTGTYTNTSGVILGTFDGSTASSNAFTAAGIILGGGGKTGWGDGDVHGAIRFYNTDGSGVGARDAAKILSVCETGNGTSTTTFSGALAFYTSEYNDQAYERVRIDKSGNVGIGTTSPTTGRLVVHGGDIEVRDSTGNTGGRIKAFDDYHAIYFREGAQNRTNYYQYGGTLSAGLGHRFLTGGTSQSLRMQIADDGIYMANNVGIGTTSPSEKLEVSGNTILDATNANLKIKAGATGTKGDIQWTFNTNSTVYASAGITYDNRATDGFLIDSGYPITLDAASGYIRFSNNGSEKMRVTTSGRLGLNSTNPEVDFQIGNNDGNRRILLYGANSQAVSSEIIFADSSSDTTIYKYGAGLRFNSADNIFSIRSWFDGANSQDASFVDFYRNTNSVSTPIQFRYDSSFDGNVGIGTTSPAVPLHVNGFARFNGGIQLDGNNRTIYAIDNTSLILGTNNTERMRIDSAGNVGIGTTSPAVKLAVTGTIYASGGSAWNGGGTEGNKTDAGLIINEGNYIYTRDSSQYLRRLIGKNTGDVITIGEAGTSLIDAVYFYSGTSCSYRWHNNTSAVMQLNSTGLGIFDTTPSYALDVNGTIRATGDIIAFSDARVKENVKTIDNALEKVTQLRGVSYNKIGETEEKIGVIAQEIEKVLPQVVAEDDNGMKSVAYGNIVGVLIEAIKEQQKQIDELKARLDA